MKKHTVTLEIHAHDDVDFSDAFNWEEAVFGLAKLPSESVRVVGWENENVTVLPDGRRIVDVEIA